MRLLIVPLSFLAFGLTAAWAFGERWQVPESLDAVVAWLRGYGEWAWLAASGVIAADAVLPMPSSPAMFTLGVIYGPALGGLVGGTASLLAGLTGFGLVRALGPRGARFVVGDADLARAEAFYARWGVTAVALGKAVGGPAEWVVVLAGLSRMPVRRVVLAIAIGAFPAGFSMAALGALAVDRPLLALAITVAVAAAVLWLGRRLVHGPTGAPQA